jgi:hypothetical protein
MLYIFHTKLTEFLFGNALYFHHFMKKKLSDYPADTMRMAVSFLYSYIDINLKILKCTVWWIVVFKYINTYIDY